MTKNFFIVVAYEPAILGKTGTSLSGKLFSKDNKEKAANRETNFEENRTQLEQRLSVVEQGLVRSGIRVVRLGTEEVIELFYKAFNPGETEKPIKTS